MTDTVTMKDFIAANRISMTAEHVDRNPNMDETAAGSMDHWKIVLKIPFKDQQRGMSTHYTMTTYFSMGYGHHGAEPDVASVLDCLSSDASSVAQSDFEDWARDLGYDTDSRKAEKIYKACQHSASRLERFLGVELYQVLLYGTERL